MLHKIILDELSSIRPLDELINYASKNCISYVKIAKVDTHFEIEYNDIDTPNNEIKSYTVYKDLLEFKLCYIMGVVNDYYLFYEVSTNTYIVNKYGQMAENIENKDKILKAMEFLRNTQEILSDLHIKDLKSNTYTYIASKKYKNNTFGEAIDVLYDSLSNSFILKGK